MTITTTEKNAATIAANRQEDPPIAVSGVLDMTDKNAFIRVTGYLPGPGDTYLSAAQVKKYGLRPGDHVEGAARSPREGDRREKFRGLVRVDKVNGLPPEQASARPEFADLTPLYPQDRLRLETDPREVTGRIIDLGAYNLAAPASSRILAGGVATTAIHPPRRFLGAARNIENGGSLTILASVLVETGSRMDEVFFEEFKGTGNMELRLRRDLADRRLFPAVDLVPSSTRRDDLIVAPAELQAMGRLRQVLSALGPQESLELVLGKLRDTSANAEFLAEIQRQDRAVPPQSPVFSCRVQSPVFSRPSRSWPGCAACRRRDPAPPPRGTR
jgi:transcription termination factor Rho